MSKPVFAFRKTFFLPISNGFLPIGKSVFPISKPVLVISKLVFPDLKTGLGDLKTCFGDLITGYVVLCSKDGEIRETKILTSFIDPFTHFFNLTAAVSSCLPCVSNIFWLCCSFVKLTNFNAENILTFRYKLRVYISEAV